MESAILSQAFAEYLRPRRVIPWILLGLFCGVLSAAWIAVIGQQGKAASHADQYTVVTTQLVYRLVALASAIFTTAIVSQEVEQRTIVYLLTRPVPRWKLLILRYCASVVVVACLGVLAAIFTSIGAYHGLGGNPMLANDVKAIIVGACAYGALFLFISLLVNRAILVCLLFAFGWEASVPYMPGSMNILSVLSHMQAIGQHSSPEKSPDLVNALMGVNAIPPDRGYAVLIGMAIVLTSVSCWWFTNFEYIPREDSE